VVPEVWPLAAREYFQSGPIWLQNLVSSVNIRPDLAVEFNYSANFGSGSGSGLFYIRGRPSTAIG
jgi:hypothetical protein